jgi:hypothetical protein
MVLSVILCQTPKSACVVGEEVVGAWVSWAHLQGMLSSLQSPAHQSQAALHLHTLPFLDGQVLAQALRSRRCGRRRPWGLSGQPQLSFQGTGLSVQGLQPGSMLGSSLTQSLQACLSLSLPGLFPPKLLLPEGLVAQLLGIPLHPELQALQVCKAAWCWYYGGFRLRGQGAGGQPGASQAEGQCFSRLMAWCCPWLWGEAGTNWASLRGWTVV